MSDPLTPPKAAPDGGEPERCAFCQVAILSGSGRFRRGDQIECPACHDSRWPSAGE